MQHMHVLTLLSASLNLIRNPQSPIIINMTLAMQVPVPAGGAAVLGGVPQRGGGRARRLGVPLGQPHRARCAPAWHPRSLLVMSI